MDTSSRVIKSASSAASRKPKSREGSSRGVQDGGSAAGRRPRGTPLELPSLDLGFLEAALAADLITAWNFTEPGEAALAADSFTAPFSQYLAVLAAKYIQKILKKWAM